MGQAIERRVSRVALGSTSPTKMGSVVPDASSGNINNNNSADTFLKSSRSVNQGTRRPTGTLGAINLSPEEHALLQNAAEAGGK